MSARPYHRRFHSDALAGFMSLTLEERGAYQTLLDLMYDRQGPILNNERLLAGYMGVSTRKWRVLCESLIEKGKISIKKDGSLTNRRVEKELENDAKTARKHAENGSNGGRKKAENEKKRNENNDGGLAGLEQKPSNTIVHSPELDEEKKEGSGGKPPAIYAFFGRTIRVKPSDLTKWRKTYHGVPDIEAELVSLDAWFDTQPEAKRASWYHTTIGALNRKHQEVMASRKEAASGPVWDGLA